MAEENQAKIALRRRQTNERVRRFRAKRNKKIANGDTVEKEKKDKEDLRNRFSSAKSYIHLHATESELEILENEIKNRRDILTEKK